MWLAVKSTATPEIPAKVLNSVMPAIPSVRNVIDRSPLEVGENQGKQVRHGCRVGGPQRAARAYEHGTVNWIVGQPAVGSAHEIPVKRDHVHHVPEAEHLLGEAPRHSELRPHARRGEKQLRRIITGLAVDLDAGREVGCLRIVEILRKPGYD